MQMKNKRLPPISSILGEREEERGGGLWKSITSVVRARTSVKCSHLWDKIQERMPAKIPNLPGVGDDGDGEEEKGERAEVSSRGPLGERD